MVVASPPSVRVWSGIAPTERGARLAIATATANVWLALKPPGSVAVTVTVAVPAATGVRVI